MNGIDYFHFLNTESSALHGQPTTGTSETQLAGTGHPLRTVVISQSACDPFQLLTGRRGGTVQPRRVKECGILDKLAQPQRGMETATCVSSRRISAITLKITRALTTGVLLFPVILMPSTAPAQTAPRTGVYTFGGVGGVSPDDAYTFWTGTTVRAGVGVDRLLSGGFGILGEMEFLFRPESPVGDSDPVKLISLNPVYHFGMGPFRPFVTGGVLLVGNPIRPSFGLNVGGGVNYWIQDRVAVRVEFRDHLLPIGTTLHSFGLRLGLGVGF